jgi:hypothetical protein
MRPPAAAIVIRDPHASMQDPHASMQDPHPNPPPCRGREYTEFGARAERRMRESRATGAFLPLKGGGIRWGSLPKHGSMDGRHEGGGAP